MVSQNCEEKKTFAFHDYGGTNYGSGKTHKLHFLTIDFDY